MPPAACDAPAATSSGTSLRHIAVSPWSTPARPDSNPELNQPSATSGAASASGAADPPLPSAASRAGRIVDDAARSKAAGSLLDHGPGRDPDTVADGLFDELDYTREAANARQFSESVALTPLAGAVFAPEPLEELTSTRVLTTAWVEGSRLDAETGEESDEPAQETAIRQEPVTMKSLVAAVEPAAAEHGQPAAGPATSHCTCRNTPLGIRSVANLKPQVCARTALYI